MRTDKDLTWEDFKNGVAYGPGLQRPKPITKKQVTFKKFTLLLKFSHYEFFTVEFNLTDLQKTWNFTQQITSVIAVDVNSYNVKMK